MSSAGGHGYQEERFELKYLINEETAARVREFVRSYLVMDEYASKEAPYSYLVHSLYLDSGGLDTYWHTINGNKNRYKLRLRYYGDQGPVFFEIKRRMNNVILKARGGVRRPAVPKILAGFLPARADLLNPSPDEVSAVDRFVRLMQALDAKPRMHVVYWREAYQSLENNSARVTMDREVLSRPETRLSAKVQREIAHTVFGSQVILELKYTTRFPKWMRELVETFDCMQGGAAKYAEGIFYKGEGWATRPPRVLGPEEVTREFLG